MSDKKKRKISEVSEPLKPPKLYEEIIEHEEKESRERNGQEDFCLYQETCKKMSNFFDEIYEAKTKDGFKKSDIEEKHQECSMYFVLLKKLNRLEKYRTAEGRNSLQKEKSTVDSNRLHLQNLLYEASHLRREIEHCKLFKSQDEDIDLIPEDEFYKTALESISRPEKTKSDSHAKRLAQLQWELHQRKELASQCKEMSVLKEKVSKENLEKKNRLNSLVPCLGNLLKATKPLQIALGMEMEEEWEMQKTVKLLPRPLFLFFVNLKAFGDSCERALSVTIEGDEEEARQIEEETLETEVPTPTQAADSDKEDDEDNGKSRKKKHHSVSGTTILTKEQIYEKKKQKLLKHHPLYVKFSIKGNKSNKNSSISINVHYFPSLNLISATSNVQTQNMGVTAGDIISTEKIVLGLYPDDFGEISPNPNSKFQLKEFDLSESDLLDYLKTNKFGKPFVWAQKLCGIDFINQNTFKEELIEHFVPEVVKKIKTKFNARLNLMKQICSLENKNIDLLTSDKDFSRVRISSSLVQWSSLSYDEFVNHPTSSKFTEMELATSHDIFYRAVITKGSAKLECLICIPYNYPSENPVWTFCLSWNGVHTSENNPAVKDMEFWTNSLDTDQLYQSPETILCAQLARTMISFDIFLETEGPLYSPAEFTQDKTFLNAFSRRTQSRPYKLVDNGSNVIFKQIFE